MYVCIHSSHLRMHSMYVHDMYVHTCALVQVYVCTCSVRTSLLECLALVGDTPLLDEGWDLTSSHEAKRHPTQQQKKQTTFKLFEEHTHTREDYRKPAHAHRDLIKVRAFSILYANVFSRLFFPWFFNEQSH